MFAFEALLTRRSHPRARHGLVKFAPNPLLELFSTWSGGGLADF